MIVKERNFEMTSMNFQNFGDINSFLTAAVII